MFKDYKIKNFTNNYHIITYGCQMNEFDSERIAAFLEDIGYRKISDLKEANLIVINMCSVRQSAVDRVYGKIKNLTKLKAQNPKLKIILTGCILKEDRKKFAKDFDLILDIKDLPKFKSKIKNQKSKTPRINSYGIIRGRQIKNQKLLNLNTEFIDYFHIKPKDTNKTLAYVPISNGCNNFCSYCVVPFTRGRLICRDHREILKEVKDLIKRGYKEIILLGQNVNSYKSKYQYQQSPVSLKRTGFVDIDFPNLLKIISKIPGDFKISFLTSHPKDFSDELIEVIARSKKIKKEIHLPFQSGDNEILKKMNRNYTREDYLNLIKKIRKKIPKIKISTDIIVGFPGETKKQFENTVNLAKKVKFVKAYIAQYSSRSGTAAAKLNDDVSKIEKKRRWQILNKIINNFK